MKLYRHYKGKDYTYVGTARHSETLEEMVIYETRYPNELGAVWVRPQEMFHESLPDGSARFRRIPLVLEETTKFGESEMDGLTSVIEQAFGRCDRAYLLARAPMHQVWHLVTAKVEGVVVGFKLGYALDSTEFYSWLGGVSPGHRGLGIASALMRRQHAWARGQKYQWVLTKSQNQFREMLILNLRHGFEVIGSEMVSNGDCKVILRKSLTGVD